MTIDNVCILAISVFCLGMATGLYIRFPENQDQDNSEYPNIYLSGAITGFEEEAKVYFSEAEAAIYDKFPGCTVFNPTRLPKLPCWEDYMMICRPRVAQSTHIVFIINPQIKSSQGVHEEKRLAKENGLAMYRYMNKEIAAI